MSEDSTEIKVSGWHPITGSEGTFGMDQEQNDPNSGLSLSQLTRTTPQTETKDETNKLKIKPRTASGSDPTYQNKTPKIPEANAPIYFKPLEEKIIRKK